LIRRERDGARYSSALYAAPRRRPGTCPTFGILLEICSKSIGTKTVPPRFLTRPLTGLGSGKPVQPCGQEVEAGRGPPEGTANAAGLLQTRRTLPRLVAALKARTPSIRACSQPTRAPSLCVRRRSDSRAVNRLLKKRAQAEQEAQTQARAIKGARELLESVREIGISINWLVDN
jgi:hypothetical protein